MSVQDRLRGALRAGLRVPVGLLVGLLFAEILLRAVLRVPAVQEALYSTEAGPRRMPLGGRCTPFSGGDAVGYDPVYGWAPEPGEHRMGDFTVGVGPERRRVVPQAPDPGARRVVLLGDSFTFGHDANDAETWAARLAARRPDLHVFNLGMDGYGHDQVLLRYLREGVALRPTLVVLGFVEADVVRNGLVRFHRPRPGARVQEGRLLWQGLPPLRDVDDCRSIAWRPWLPVLASWWRVDERRRLDEAKALTGHLLDALHEGVRRSGAELWVVRLPEASQDRRGLAPPWNTYPPREEGFALDAWCARTGVRCLDAREALLAGDVDVAPLFASGWHYSALGNERVGAFLAEVLPRAAAEPDRDGGPIAP